jgi:hypothetical protein
MPGFMPGSHLYRFTPSKTPHISHPVIPGRTTELGFTRVRHYHCPSRQQPTWMRGPGIHSSMVIMDSGLAASRRPGMTALIFEVVSN